MHAYASDDPVFVAMNARFLRETNSTSPAFCIRCHAPVALVENATTDGTNMATVDAKLHGVTCFFCHTVSSVGVAHNDGLVIANDGVMRGPISNPVTAPHASQYSALHDSTDPTSSSLCGGCHDLVNDSAVHIERTYEEWQASLYAENNPSTMETCNACHMTSSIGVAATTNGAPQRRVHDHSLAAFDVALAPFSSTDVDQKNLVQQTLDDSIVAKLCVNQPTGAPNVMVTLDNAFVGHEFPSGASHDRRVWLELHASANGVDVLTSGVTLADPSTWLLRDTLLDSSQQPTLFMWNAASVTSNLLPPPTTNDPNSPAFVHSVTQTFLAPPETDHVTIIVHAQAIGADVLGSLVASGDLDTSIASAMPTFDLTGTSHAWDKSAGYGCAP